MRSALPDVGSATCLHRHVSSGHECFAESFLGQVETFRQWLGERSEHRIGIVSHSGTLHALTGHQFINGELYSCRFDDLIKRPRSWPMDRTPLQRH